MARLDHVSGVVCAQVAVDGKNNEIPMFAPLLDQIADLAGVLVTADAMHAQRRHATYLHNRSAHYLLTVKRNQPSLRSQLRALPWKQIPAGDTQAGRSHGRVEKRIVKAVTVTEGLLFPHAPTTPYSRIRPITHSQNVGALMPGRLPPVPNSHPTVSSQIPIWPFRVHSRGQALRDAPALAGV